MHSNSQENELIDEYWDDIVGQGGGQPHCPSDLDPTLATVIDWLHADKDMPSADPSFVAKLRRELLNIARRSSATGF
jgi:hypothetical protein